MGEDISFNVTIGGMYSSSDDTADCDGDAGGDGDVISGIAVGTAHK